MARVVPGLVAFLAAAGFYLLLAGSLSRNELITAGVVAAAFAILVVVLRLRQETRLGLPIPPLTAMLRPILALLTDSGRVGAVLLRVVARRPEGGYGTITPQPFRPGGSTPEDAGRRGLVTLGSSLAPNGYVLEWSPSQDALLMHRLAAVSSSENTEWPT